jgi:hypothetical protein
MSDLEGKQIPGKGWHQKNENRFFFHQLEDFSKIGKED